MALLAAAQQTAPRAAAVYRRISDDRTGDAAGVGRQEADCRALAKRLGWTVAGVYTDNDISAYTGRKRPDYLRMLPVRSREACWPVTRAPGLCRPHGRVADQQDSL